MKDFVKMMLAVVCGLITVQILKGIFLVLMIVNIAATAASSDSAYPKTGVLDLNLSLLQITDQENQDPFAAFGGLNSGQTISNISLRNAINAIGEASKPDSGIDYILLRPDGVNAGLADLEEIRAALLACRNSGKAIIAYLENPGNASYYLASAADRIILSSNKGGTYQLVGLSGQMTFLKDLLDKLGVKMQLIRHGKYKSAGETFVRSSSSPQNREQNLEMIRGEWNNITSEISASREISPEDLNALVDRLALVFPEDFLKAGLVDELADHEELLSRLAELAMLDSPEDLSLVPFAQYSKSVNAQALFSKANIAILYASGNIVDGHALEGVAGDRYVGIIDKLRKDSSIKAVVLRVNSGGGSVSASEKIRKALVLLEKEKPLVVSFGNYAASGGYWISTPGNVIYTDANTLTGSIGVFSMLPEFSGTASKIGVKVETVNSNAHSDMFSGMRPLDAAEIACMQASVEDIYDTFTSIVAEARGLSVEEVDRIGQGRVWIGSEAVKLSLADKTGTLEDAVQEAAALAGIPDSYKVCEYPGVPGFAEQIAMAFGQDTGEPAILTSLKNLKEPKTYAVMPYKIEIK